MSPASRRRGRFVSDHMYYRQRGLSLKDIRWWDVDWHILLLALVLLGFGCLFLRAMALADLELGQDSISFDGHMKKVLVAAPALFLGLLVRPSWLRNKAYLFYGLCLILLLLVPLIGDERNNARRWISLPMGFDLQPSELAKLGLILALARALARDRLQHLGSWAKPLLIAAVPITMVAMQPDLGTAMTIVPVTLGMMYLAGARASLILRLVALVALVGFSLWQLEIGVRDYQAQRIDTWVSSFQPEGLIDGKNGPAFHVYHARVAIGNGGLLGTGLGAGIANETGYLPERDSDSVIAVMAEEVGLIGTAGLLLIYTLMILLLLASASTIRDRFSRLVVGGIALYFAAHFFINVSVNLGLLPMTGLTLPLFSTGGSSLLATFAALGLALGMAAHHEPSFDKDAFKAY